MKLKPRHIRRILTIIFILAAAVLVAQEQDVASLLGDLRISEEEAEQIGRIQSAYLEEVRLPRAELDVIRARLTRELVKDAPSMGEIERILETGISFEVDLRLAEIRRELAMRELLGSQRWTRFKQLARMVGERAESSELLLQRLQRTRPEAARILRIIQQYAQQ